MFYDFVFATSILSSRSVRCMDATVANIHPHLFPTPTRGAVRSCYAKLYNPYAMHQITFSVAQLSLCSLEHVPFMLDAAQVA